MWLVGYRAFRNSIGSAIHGTGPGTGSRTYSRISVLDPNVEYDVGGTPALHSLYVQLAVETGSLGLLPFLVGIILTFTNIIARMEERPDFVPLLCFFGYTIIIATSSGTDTVSGIFLGIALLGGMHGPYSFETGKNSQSRSQDVGAVGSVAAGSSTA
jgi:O-antigen ligase